MKPRTLLPLALSLLAATATANVHAQDVPTLLKAADKFRMSADNLQVDTLINVQNADGSPDKERRYKVFAQAGRKSLVLMQSPAEAGQKVLMLGDDFWLLMPNSQRPLRITPMQKLLGDASTGDIATMSWAEDYTGKLVGEEACAAPAANPAAVASIAASAAQAPTCLHLSLNATRKGVTYQRIELWLGKARHEPVRADLYVLSDKLAKQARFVMDKATTPTTVTEMVLTDQVSNHKTTHVRYLNRQERVVPPEWLNPMFLVRNPPLE
ncbi:outer membrane lipoprotein-sorting protein [Rhodoferax sp.]|uniref:outer membrane lipoprotein-sorting protein n=1 Tax=Rhodoferax sp. TaxID=50421 RepID=UPI00284B4CED|nr:outer membrane lipoprotein-sorting protein [Rhodoferax sp.]MDR3367635.1 outer membrane lipoprotein-sorting protein [Rhodoferax sp.]